ncbi:hypothetical protein J5N97_000876 [Dioscorea zingiberensis]|uniref:Uncharacterized protein n=1 Tax=Dioscorea zingiberensis TaxID=325984 RepID=A0A9D5BVK0_9LILI|nr:hypothetical protein J5N97_000876 [Dioscorea zingiberensis]
MTRETQNVTPNQENVGSPVCVAAESVFGKMSSRRMMTIGRIISKSLNLRFSWTWQCLLKLKEKPKKHGTTVDSERLRTKQPTEGHSDEITTGGDILNNVLDYSSDEGNDDLVADASDSDGFLSEDSDCLYISEKEDENIFEEKCDHSALLEQNKQLALEIEGHKKKWKFQKGGT